MWQQEEASSNAEQGLLRQMPTILRLLSSALDEHASSDSCQSDVAGSPSRAAGNPLHLPGQVAEEPR